MYIYVCIIMCLRVAGMSSRLYLSQVTSTGADLILNPRMLVCKPYTMGFKPVAIPSLDAPFALMPRAATDSHWNLRRRVLRPKLNKTRHL
jgi:hypothetical protein